jgi:hypothetical protein
MKLVGVNLDELTKAHEDLSFGGYPVDVDHDLDTDVTIVTCKGVTGTVGQLENWLYNHYKDTLTTYYFGIGDKLSEIVRDGNEVKIACLKENYVEFKLKLNRLIHGINKCKKQLS